MNYANKVPAVILGLTSAAIGTAVSLVLNGVLDYLLMQKMGVAGIALPTSLVYVASFGYLFVMATRVMRERVQAPVKYI